MFSFIVPGYTAVTFGNDQINTFCDKLVSVNAPSYTKEVCSVSVSTVDGTNAMVNGYFFYEWTQAPNQKNMELVTALRDQTVTNLRKNAGSAFTPNFNGVYANCACKGLQTVTASSTSDFNYDTNLTGIPGPVQCGARLIYNTDTPNGEINIVGVDDGSTSYANFGKYCSTPAVAGGVLGNPGSGSCRQYGVVTTTSGSVQATAQASSPSGGRIPGINVVSGGSGYQEQPTVTISGPNPTPVEAFFTMDGASVNQQAGIATQVNGPYAAQPSGTLGGGICVDTSPAGTVAKCSGPQTSIEDVTGVVASGTQCTSNDFNSNTGCIVNGKAGSCVQWNGNSNNMAVTAVYFPGSGGSNVKCTMAPTVSFSNQYLQDPVQAAAYAQVSGGSVSSIVVLNPGSGYASTPTITIASPSTNNYGQLCGPNPIPGLPLSTSYENPVSITTGGECQPIGLDTQANKACSSPNSPGDTIKEPINVGTCNVQSSFRNQPNNPSDTYQCAILKQAFVTVVVKSRLGIIRSLVEKVKAMG